MASHLSLSVSCDRGGNIDVVPAFGTVRSETRYGQLSLGKNHLIRSACAPAAIFGSKKIIILKVMKPQSVSPDPSFKMNSPWHSLTDKSIWVLGGAGYLGSAITAALDGEGARVICVDLGDKAEKFVREQSLKNTIAVSQDVFQVEALEGFVERLVEEHGTPDGLVNLAAYSSAGKTLEEISVEEFQAPYLKSNTSYFVVSRAVAERMRTQGGGSIVLFASMYGVVSPDPSVYAPPMIPNPIDYGASKAGILQMARYMAVHYGPHGVRVNSITPGPFPNPMVQKMDPEFIERLSAKTPMKRVGQNSEIVGPTLFLLSPGASFVTGHSLDVDGGWMAW